MRIEHELINLKYKDQPLDLLNEFIDATGVPPRAIAEHIMDDRDYDIPNDLVRYVHLFMVGMLPHTKLIDFMMFKMNAFMLDMDYKFKYDQAVCNKCNVPVGALEWEHIFNQLLIERPNLTLGQARILKAFYDLHK